MYVSNILILHRNILYEKLRSCQNKQEQKWSFTKIKLASKRDPNEKKRREDRIEIIMKVGDIRCEKI